MTTRTRKGRTSSRSHLRVLLLIYALDGRLKMRVSHLHRYRQGGYAHRPSRKLTPNRITALSPSSKRTTDPSMGSSISSSGCSPPQCFTAKHARTQRRTPRNILRHCRCCLLPTLAVLYHNDVFLPSSSPSRLQTLGRDALPDRALG